MITSDISRSFFSSAISLLVALILISGSGSLYGQASENEMKAVALEKIAMFIEWPPASTLNQRNQIVIAVYRQQEFSRVLQDVYKDHKIKEKSVRIVTVSDIRELPVCDILFIPREKKTVLKIILQTLKSLPVMTVADTEGFGEEGCDVNFFSEDGRLRFEINQNEMRDSGFTIDYKLLRVARIVSSSDRQPY